MQRHVSALLIDTLVHSGDERALNFNLHKSFFFFLHFFFVEPVMNDTMEGRFPFCHNKKRGSKSGTNFCVDGLILEGGPGL